jgi:hypothetical protein
VQKGPFTESLPEPLTAAGLATVRIGGPSSARKLAAVQLKVDTQCSGDPALNLFSEIEVYPTEADARTRGNARMSFLTRNYETGSERATLESFCVYSDAFWACGGVRGFVYAEVTVSPNPNAYLPFATETLAALLRYGDRMTQLATS